MRDQITLDPGLIRGYSEELQKLEPNAPYVARFHSAAKNKTLLYIASQHSTGADNASCETIRHVMEGNKIDCMIIEGITTEHSKTEEFSKYIDKCKEQNFAGHGEPMYAFSLAKDKTIPFIGGEPSEETIFTGLNAKGYSNHDIVAFYLLSQITQHNRDGKFEDEVQFDGFCNGYLQNSPRLKHLSAADKKTVTEFKEWYGKHNDKPNRSYLHIGTQDIAPITLDTAGYFNKMCAHVGDVRELHLIGQINSSLQQYDNVLVVYGSGHLVKSRPVFKAAMPIVENFKVGGIKTQLTL